MDDAAPLTVKLKQMEFGTSTGRQRMVGWYDAVEKGDVLRYGGYQDLMINKIDALSGAAELLICTAYEDAAGKRYAHVPRNEALRKTLRPVYSKHPGWPEDISGIRKFSDLPRNAQLYTAAMVRSLVEVAYPGQLPAVLPNLRYLGVGPEPSQIIKDVPAAADLIKLV
jgi:adenylosuccinate synthase